MLPSFTPINRGPSKLLNPNPAFKLPIGGKDSDKLYDIPSDDDILPAPLLPQKRKRRTTSPSRNKSIPAPPIKQGRHHEGDNPLTRRFPYISAIEQPTFSQRVTSSNSQKNIITRTKSAVSKQTKAFPNTAIIKPNVHQPYIDGSSIKPGTDYTIGTPSTLDKITKVGHNGLAKTTLEKLAAFRFKTPSVDVVLDYSPSQNSVISTTTLDKFIRTDDPGVRNGGTELSQIDVSHDLQEVVGQKIQEHASNPVAFAEEAVEAPEEAFDDLFDELEIDSIYCQKEIITAAPAHSHVNNHKDHFAQCFTSNSGDITAVKNGPFMTTEAQTIPYFIDDCPRSSQVWDEGLLDDDFAQLDTGETILLNEATASHKAIMSTHIEDVNELSSDDYDGGVADDDFMELMVEDERIEANLPGNQTTPFDTDYQLNTGVEDSIPGSLSLEVIDDDDEYPMDDYDEAELAKLAELAGPLIIESNSPPSNWLPSDAESRDREVYDEKLGHSPISSKPIHEKRSRVQENLINECQLRPHASIESLAEPEDWSFLNQPRSLPDKNESFRQDTPPTTLPEPSRPYSVTDDRHEYLPLSPFARPPFPVKVLDRSPVPGITSNSLLRTCFRIGEALRAGSVCSHLRQDAVIELFARVTFSSREDGSHKQHFQFADLFHSNPPFVAAVLENYLVSPLQETESRALLTAVGEPREGEMVRCLGRLKRKLKGNGWVMHVINIRKTDWEEVRWTKRIVGAGDAKPEAQYEPETTTRRNF